MPIDRTAKSALDANLVNGVTSDAPKVKANNDTLYNFVDGLESADSTHANAATLAHPDQSVTTAKIKDLAVTNAKYAPLSITNDKIAPGTIDATKFVAGALANETQNGLAIVEINEQMADIANAVGINIESYPIIAPEVNDTGRFQRAVNASVANGYAPIIITKPYTISDTILFPESFIKPIIIGRGYKTSKINYPDMPLGKPAFKFKGGSGQSSGGHIFGVGFYGNANSVGIELADVNGFNTYRCQFGLNKIGVLLHNEVGFTEYCVADECDFLDTCKTAIEYKKEVAGNTSFHGSGLRACTINQAVGETEPKIKIGVDCVPYNAPLSFQIWTHSSAPIIQNFNTTVIGRGVTMHGDITVEPDGITVELVDSAHTIVYMLASVSCNNESLKLGKAILCERIQSNSDGTLTIQRKIYAQQFDMTTGTNNTIWVDNGINAIINVIVEAPNYIYAYTLSVWCNPYSGVGSVTILSTNSEFNGAGYGAPTFSFADNTLKITNAGFPASGVIAYMSIQEVGSRWQYKLK